MIDEPRENKQPDTLIEDLGNGVTLELIRIPAGEFLMGTDEAEIEKRCQDNNSKWFEDDEWLKREHPQHLVELSSFYLGIYPVTQAQYQAVMGNNPSHFQGENKPVECVSWDDAQEFCRKLAEMMGKPYQLPSEAQWEYACRAKSATRYYFGDDASQLGDYGWYSENSKLQTRRVGRKKPNQWGLYDMYGNVWEWCADTWHDNYEDAPNDGSAWMNKSSIYVMRGGSCSYTFNDCRSAVRNYAWRNSLSQSCGFRVVCVVGRTSQPSIL